ncbi:M20/M25/M40 family metallo-hydrolase [uncultured Duncaniella sp.]|uniref:M20/M25/M40 family metallo-hydrolase n=1 Tax=uncultured Duncaniella sp. TaxID=2768039 RepID=UPI0026EB6C51|nr:M20/M25/M40 family metallo-hydrolase [uncultured Duncaniella sp.]
MTRNAVELLSRLIATPSVSRNEENTAAILAEYLSEAGCEVERIYNNVIARSADWREELPVLMLNSHHDTVPPAASYTRDPYAPELIDGRLYGLGSNDAGASLVSIVETFGNVHRMQLPFNILLVLSAEEECSGEKGFRGIYPQLGRIDAGIVGEPTGLQAAVGERGLVVLDCVSHGVSGHAARREGVNALYAAVDDIEKLRNLSFPRVSGLLGDISVNVTMIQAGTRHNVIPDECRWVVDIRTTDVMTNEEVVEYIRTAIPETEVIPRSTRIRASTIADNHPLVIAAKSLGASVFVSPTTSDMALMPFPTLKIGPGESSRSHSADEFVKISEISDGIKFYTDLIKNIRF